MAALSDPDVLAEALHQRVPGKIERLDEVRAITTTYLGATDARASDALVDEFGAEVRVNYETDRTRLHAKAWLLRRNNGFHTAYVGSSNLSHTALVDGLEWDVRLFAVSTPHLLEKFRATFESYWENREFEPYWPSSDDARLREALDIAARGRQRDRLTVTLSGLEVQPKPYQAEMLEEPIRNEFCMTALTLARRKRHGTRRGQPKPSGGERPARRGQVYRSWAAASAVPKCS